jgi:hypothetical protein
VFWEFIIEKWPPFTQALQAIEMELMDELKASMLLDIKLSKRAKIISVRKRLRMPSLQWTTVAIDDVIILFFLSIWF